MTLAAYLSDNVTLAGSIAFAGVAGSSSSATSVHLWLDKGTAGGAAHGIKLWPEIQVSGVWVGTGHAALDDGWFQIKVSGGTGPTTESRFVTPTGTAYRVVKYSKPFDVGELYGNCSVYLDVRIVVRSDAAAASFNWRVRVTSDFVSQTTDPNLPCGVLRGLDDTSRWEWILAPVITATGTPDSHVHGSFHSSNWFGVFRQRCVLDDITLNQNDVAAAALTIGQAYKTLIYRTSDHSTALTVLKGTKASSASAVIPTLPAGGLPVAVVHVAYGAGGSVITSGNITNLAVDGWARVQAGTGLNALVGRFRIQVPGSLVEVNAQQTVALTASSTNRIWTNSDGTTSVVTADGNPPYIGSEQIASVTTDGSGVTAIDQSMLRFEDSAGEWVSLPPQSGNETAATDISTVQIPYKFQIVATRGAVRTASIGASGGTLIDVNLHTTGAGVTIFTNRTPETRPSVAAQALTETASAPEVTTGDAGNYLSWDIDAVSTSGTRAITASVAVLIYPRP